LPRASAHGVGTRFGGRHVVVCAGIESGGKLVAVYVDSTWRCHCCDLPDLLGTPLRGSLSVVDV
jgi:hypothetical protein